MKVLIYFSGPLFEPKGTPIRTRNVVAQLLAQGIDTYYAGQDSPEGLGPDRVLKLARPHARILQLIRYVNRERIDVVYIQTSAALWLVPFLWIGTRAALGIDFHNRIYQEGRYYHGYSTAGTWVREQFELLLCRFLSFGTAVSYTLRDFYTAAVPRFLVVPVGVDLSTFRADITPRQDLVEWKGDTVLIGYAGNLKWYQGLDTVLEAFQKAEAAHPGKFSFLLIGSSGPADTEAFLAAHPLAGKVRILGKQPHSDIPPLLAAADILSVVRPSSIITEYAFPSKFPEYAALGKALVASRVSDIERYIVSGENGILVAPEDVQGLAGAFVTLLDPALRSTLSKGAQALAAERFDLNALGRELAGFLKNVKR